MNLNQVLISIKLKLKDFCFNFGDFLCLRIFIFLRFYLLKFSIYFAIQEPLKPFCIYLDTV